MGWGRADGKERLEEQGWAGMDGWGRTERSGIGVGGMARDQLKWDGMDGWEWMDNDGWTIIANAPEGTLPWP